MRINKRQQITDDALLHSVVHHRKGVRQVNKETRSMAENIEFRDSDSGDQYIEGYALKFDTWSEDLGGFRESIHKDALKNTDTSDVRALFNHNADHIIARSAAGSLELDV